MTIFVTRPTAPARLPSTLYDTVRLKVLLLGNPGTGKSSFLNNLYKHVLSFSKNVATDALSADYSFSHTSLPTVAVDYCMLPVFLASHSPKPTVYTTNAPLLKSDLAPLSLGVPGDGPAGLSRIGVCVFDCSGDLGYARVRAEACTSWDFCVIFLDADGSGAHEWLREAMEYGPRGPASKFLFAAAKADVQASPSWSHVCSRAPSMEAWGLQRTPDERVIFSIDNTTGKGVSALWDSIFTRSRQCGERVARDRFTDVQAEAHKDTNVKPTPTAAGAKADTAHTATGAGGASTGMGSASTGTGSAGGGMGAVEGMSVAELRAELRALGVPQAQWGFERQEMVQVLLQARMSKSQQSSSSDTSTHNQSDRAAASPGGTGVAAAAPAVDTDRLMTTVRAEVEVWAKGKSFVDMLNSVNAAAIGTELYVNISSPSDAVSKAYKRAMLRVHPDKQVPGNRHAILRATETFKVLNNAHDVYRKEKENASVISSASTTTSTRADTQKYGFTGPSGGAKATFGSRRR